jgi:hypothetical protein
MVNLVKRSSVFSIFGLFSIISLITRAENAKLGDAIKNQQLGVERWFSPFQNPLDEYYHLRLAIQKSET